MGWLMWLWALGGAWASVDLEAVGARWAARLWSGARAVGAAPAEALPPARLQTACGFDTHEPDDARDQARTMDAGQVFRTCREDVDWFAWTPEVLGSQTLRVADADGGPVPVRVEVYAPRRRRGRVLRPDRLGLAHYRVRQLGPHRLRISGLRGARYRLWPPPPTALPDDAPVGVP